MDRGAIELPDPITVAMTVNTSRAPVGGTRRSEPQPADTGLGTSHLLHRGLRRRGPAATSTSSTITHAYSTVSDQAYAIVASVTDSLGNIDSTARQPPDFVSVLPPSTWVPSMYAVRVNETNPFEFLAGIDANTDDWSIVSTICDFGDGTGPSTNCQHTYQKPGIYRVAATATGAAGNTASGRSRSREAPRPGREGRCATCSRDRRAAVSGGCATRPGCGPLPQVRFSLANRTISATTSPPIGGRPGGFG